MHSGPRGALSREAEDIIVADAALAVAFAIAISVNSGGLLNGQFFYMLPQAFVAVTCAFVLHELMHKYVAIHFGAPAAFMRSDRGIMITLISSLTGFLLGLPGATVIYSHGFTREQEGIVSLAGPLTNFAVFAVFFVLSATTNFGNYVQATFNLTLYVSLYLAFFNMLPMYPLDGSKVLRWNMPVYLVVMAVIFGLLYAISGPGLLTGLIFVLIIAFVLSNFFRAMAF